MKLNHDCVRDVLLYLEDNLSYGNFVHSSDLKIKSYSHEEILYCIDKLFEAGFLNCDRQTDLSSVFPWFLIKSISYDGHSFLDNIRDNNVWRKTKNITKSFTSTSINLLSNIASQVISNAIIASFKS